jgi:hypothetical protein
VKNLWMIVVICGLAGCESSTGSDVVDATVAEVSVDAGQIDLGDQTWSTCPLAWPPAPPLVYCGISLGVTCYEIRFNGIVIGDTVRSLLPCRDVDGIVLYPSDEGDCKACAAYGITR